MIRKVFSLIHDFHVLIVDDSSPDGTAAIVKQLMNEFASKLFLEERTGKLGLGTAYIHGFKWAIAKKYDYIFEMDCDFSHNPEDLIQLYNACAVDGADMAIGSSTASTVRCQVKAAAPQPIAGGGDEASVYRRAQGAQCHGQHLIDCDRMEPEIHDGRRWRFAALKNEIAEIGVEGEQYTRLGARQRQHPAIVEAG